MALTGETTAVVAPADPPIAIPVGPNPVTASENVTSKTIGLPFVGSLWLAPCSIVTVGIASTNTVALSLLDRGGASNVALLAILALIAVVAVVIDRRSFLIAAIGYILVLTGTLFDWSGSAVLVMLFGAALLGLGAFWDRIRAALVAPLPEALKRRLPPAGGVV